jgi:hypothetical protein
MKLKKHFTSLFLSLLIYSCANQLPPGGGPVDKTPPEIVYVYPPNGTTNFKDDHFEIEFSEYVDKRSVQDAIFISPAVNGSLEFDWSGKSLQVDFPEKLKENLTYVVTIGTNAADLNNHNKMAQAYSFTFSTGDIIDRGIIEGKIYVAKPQGIMMYGYSVGDSVINPTKQKPKYISQAGENGEYKLLGLANGLYRVFAFQDEYGDLIYNIGDDAFGCPYREVPITYQDSIFYNLDFLMSREDTLKPRLINAAMTDRYHILLEFNEPVDSTTIIPGNFTVIDSTINKEINPLYAFRGKGKRENAVLVIKDSLSEQDNNYVAAKNIKDIAGNISESDITQLVVSERPDTSAPVLYSAKSIPEITEDKIIENFAFYFDDGFDSSLAKKGISVSERKGATVPSKIIFIDNASFKVEVTGELKPNENYVVNIDLNNIVDAAGNKRDSVYKYGFKPALPNEFSAVSGKVEIPKDPITGNVMVVLQSTEAGNLKIQKKADSKHTWKFNRVYPGKYLLWSYIDSDSSSTYSYGKPYPFNPSERFVYYPDTLKLRARWPVADVKIEYK